MKRFWAVSLIMLAAATAQASYLYWQVDTTSESLATALSNYNTKWNVQGDAGVTVGDITGARLVQVETASPETTRELDRVGVSGFNDSRSVDIGALGANYSYYIEIISLKSNLPYETVAKSSMLTYAELQNLAYVGNEMNVPQISLNAWSGGAFSAAPEPTSGLLVLIGVGLLGLKRKRA